MTSGRPRASRCRPGDARRRLDQAEAFADRATLTEAAADPGPERSVAVSDAVLAGIAAADAICCQRLGWHAADADHRRAIDLIREVPDVGEAAAAALRALLEVKQKAQYSAADPSIDETKRAMRQMAVLLDLARDVVG